MKRLLQLALLSVSFAVFTAPIVAADAPAETKAPDKSPVAPIATTVSTVTGIAISPLLGTSGYGAYKYFTAKTPEEKQSLPWFAQLSFWLPATLLVGACAAKDSLGAVVPAGLKKPLDILETIENKASGLVAAGAVVPFTMDSLSKMIALQVPQEHSIATGLAMINLGSIDFSWLLNLLTVPLGIAMFALVWMASHAINVLILLSPWGAIDAALKSARTALLGLVTLTATLNPWVGAVLSLVLIVIAYFVAGWSFRLTVFGSVFCWDFLTLRKHRFTPKDGANKLFSGKQLTERGVPIRTYGQLARQADTGTWTFTYKPWLVLPARSIEVPSADTSIGRGLFFSTVRAGEDTLFTLPPRYRTHEEQLVTLYAIPGGVQPAGLRKAWGAIKELFGARATKPQAVAAA
ncbi:MAG TPA: hypothetical protein PL015_13190 [Opitutaceae bacterium]|nr:hypothetical protein [Opitutaceae bacterium]